MGRPTGYWRWAIGYWVWVRGHSRSELWDALRAIGDWLLAIGYGRLAIGYGLEDARGAICIETKIRFVVLATKIIKNQGTIFKTIHDNGNVNYCQFEEKAFVFSQMNA
jgi:hypothetical protein